MRQPWPLPALLERHETRTGRGIQRHLASRNGTIHSSLELVTWKFQKCFFLSLFRFRCITPYPPNSEYELELRIGDVVYVHKKREDGWYKGTLHRTGKTGLFPASFVESY